MNTTKLIRHEVEIDIEEELNQWCYDSHLWDKQMHDVLPSYKCLWCGHALYSELSISSFKKPCPQNPRIKEEE